MACPCEQGFPLRDHPIHSASELNDGKGGDGRPNGDQSRDRGG